MVNTSSTLPFLHSSIPLWYSSIRSRPSEQDGRARAGHSARHPSVIAKPAELSCRKWRLETPLRGWRERENGSVISLFLAKEVAVQPGALDDVTATQPRTTVADPSPRVPYCHTIPYHTKPNHTIPYQAGITDWGEGAPVSTTYCTVVMAVLSTT